MIEEQEESSGEHDVGRDDKNEALCDHAALDHSNARVGNHRNEHN